MSRLRAFGGEAIFLPLRELLGNPNFPPTRSFTLILRGGFPNLYPEDGMLREVGRKFIEFIGSIKEHNAELSDEDQTLLDALAVEDAETEPTSYAYLLLDLAEADQKVDPKEISIIAQVLRSRFQISDDDAREAIQNASAALQAFRGPESFVDRIREEYSSEEREAILGMIERVIDADGQRGDYELLLRDQFKRLLD